MISGMAEELDVDLIRRVAARDRDAFETLYLRHAPRIRRYLLRVLRRPDLAEEALDDVMLVVWQSAERFDGTSRLTTWMLGIAHNKAMKASARGGAARRAEQPLEDAPVAAMEDQGEGPEASVLRREMGGALHRALADLPPEQRAVVELTFGQGMAYGEIATIVGCPVNTVKSRMFHARRRLAGLLGSLGFGRTPRASEASL